MRAPAITLSDHRAVYDAKGGRQQEEGRGWKNADTCGQGKGVGIGVFFADVLSGQPLAVSWKQFNTVMGFGHPTYLLLHDNN